VPAFLGGVALISAKKAHLDAEGWDADGRDR
jgi:hypothetical protein